MLKFFVLLSLIFFVDGKLDCSCAPNIDDRIVNGERAANHEFPWQLSLALLRNDEVFHICGAAALNSEWVMTAAHCVYGFDDPKNYLIGGGSNDLKEMTKDKRIPAANIIIHPDYDATTPSSFGDIALIKLSSPFELNSFISPSCLLKSSRDFDQIIDENPKKVVFASGWGSTTRTYKWIVGGLRGGKISRYLKKANFFVQQSNEQNSDCRDRDDLICLKPVTKGDSPCNGDSGGPSQMIIEPESNENNNSTSSLSNRMSVVGLTSFGSGDLTITGYTYYCNGKVAYTKVSYHQDFITQNINEDDLCFI